MSRSLHRRVFVVGGHITPFIGKGNPNFIDKKHPLFGKKENPDLEDYLRMSVDGAFAETGADASVIDRAIVGNFAADLFNSQGHIGSLLVAAKPELKFLPAWHVEGACASGGLAYSSGIESILAGSDVVLAVGAEAQTTVSARQGGDYLARASHYKTQRSIDDFTFPALFARRMKAYCEKYGISPADVAHISAKAYKNGNLNPLAHMHAIKMPYEVAAEASDKNPNFLSNEELKPWLKISDCSQVSDGGAALILASEEGLRKLGKTPADCIEVLSYNVAANNLAVDGDLTAVETIKYSSQKSLADAKISASDINVAEVHDCFNIAEMLTYEALGWAKPGQGAQLAKDGVTDIDGKYPTNTGGGLISFGHPVGATGIKQVLEVCKQLKGQAGAYQVGGSNSSQWPSMGLTINMGGDDKTVVSSVLTTKTL